MYSSCFGLSMNHPSSHRPTSFFRGVNYLTALSELSDSSEFAISLQHFSNLFDFVAAIRNGNVERAGDERLPGGKIRQPSLQALQPRRDIFGRSVFRANSTGLTVVVVEVSYGKLDFVVRTFLKFNAPTTQGAMNESFDHRGSRTS